jgi:hypothetical protein
MPREHFRGQVGGVNLRSRTGDVQKEKTWGGITHDAAPNS